MRKLVASVVLVIVGLVASPAQACDGYWDCNEVEYGWYCVWYPG